MTMHPPDDGRYSCPAAPAERFLAILDRRESETCEASGNTTGVL